MKFDDKYKLNFKIWGEKIRKQFVYFELIGKIVIKIYFEY